MVDRQAGEDTLERERSARRVLEGYRERRRRRRGEDTYFGSEALFRDTIEHGLTAQQLDSRRASILEEARRDGMPVDLAELLYDIAWDEGLDPALAFELVRTGLGVAPPPEGIANVAEVPASDRYLPTWMFPPTPPEDLLRERMLRISFRRLRAILQEESDPDTAFIRFANEPDVGHFGY